MQAQDLKLNNDFTLNNGVIEIDGEFYMRDAKGALVPEKIVKATDKMMDQTVRYMMGFAQELSAQVGRFKGHCFADIDNLQALLAEKYEAKLGGPKGNITLTSYDGTQRVSVQMADRFIFGPELQAAKSLVDDCLNEWSEGSNDNLKALVNHAFQVDCQGQINAHELLMLMRYDISDARWQQAMAAVRDSIRVIGSKAYIRFYRRANSAAPWVPVAIDMAQV